MSAAEVLNGLCELLRYGPVQAVVQANITVARVSPYGGSQFVGDSAALIGRAMLDAAGVRQAIEKVGRVEDGVGRKTRMQMFEYLEVSPQPPKVRFPEPTRRWQSLSAARTEILG